MADEQGFPHCTKWKNYRYPLTLIPRARYGIVGETGEFETAPLDIWISDDWFLYGDALRSYYSVSMTSSGGGDKISSIYRPRVFTDGREGQSTSGQSVISTGERWALLGNMDTFIKLDVISSLASTKSSLLGPQSLYTIAPGLHFGFTSVSSTAYGSGDYFTWEMQATTLDGIPKVMDGTYTCWYQTPLAGGDTVFTEPFPHSIGNKSFNLMWNSNRHVGKRSSLDINNGQSVILEGSENGIDYYEIVKLVDDVDVGTLGSEVLSAKWDSNALDGTDSSFKRLKFEFEAAEGGEAATCTMQPFQYIQVGITPN